MNTYSRLSPSPRYRELSMLYRDLHENGEPASGESGKEMFDGRSLLPQVGLIKQLCDFFEAKTLLDYGSGKGMQYGKLPITLADGRKYSSVPELWGVQVTCYDPGYEPYSVLPDGPFDVVISTDVLEHCPEEDLEWIVGEMFERAGKLVYANAANYLAGRHFRTGENVHITLHTMPWWQALFERVAARHPDVRWLLSVTERYLQDGKVQESVFYAGTVAVNHGAGTT